MADRPILFSGPMVRALLGGRKTQTRRTMPDQSLFRDGTAGPEIWTGFMGWQFIPWALENRGACGKGVLPRIAIGDRLYVREHWRTSGSLDSIAPRDLPRTAAVLYNADEERPVWAGKHRQAMHMPRWASRLTLTVTDVRVERLQDITWQDSEAEGVWHSSQEYREKVCILRDAPAALQRLRVEEYGKLWDSINGEGAWDANPWIVAYTFTVQRGNIDQIGRAA